MTLDEFFDALAETRDMGWKCSERGVLRAKTNDLISFCPITAVAMHKLGEHYNSSDFLSAASALDLDSVIACEIAFSADTSSHEFANLHQRLKMAVLA